MLRAFRGYACHRRLCCCACRGVGCSNCHGLQLRLYCCGCQSWLGIRSRHWLQSCSWRQLVCCDHCRLGRCTWFRRLSCCADHWLGWYRCCRSGHQLVYFSCPGWRRRSPALRHILLRTFDCCRRQQRGLIGDGRCNWRTGLCTLLRERDSCCSLPHTRLAAVPDCWHWGGHCWTTLSRRLHS